MKKRFRTIGEPPLVVPFVDGVDTLPVDWRLPDVPVISRVIYRGTEVDRLQVSAAERALIHQIPATRIQKGRITAAIDNRGCLSIQVRAGTPEPTFLSVLQLLATHHE